MKLPVTRLTITKRWDNLPASHRQPKHDGHCRLTHGHDWAFEVTFTCETLDDCGFVVDFGKLKAVKVWLETCFDHTFLVNADDPKLSELEKLDTEGLAKIVLVDDCSCEGLAKFVFDNVTGMIFDGRLGDSAKDRRLQVVKVTVHEDSRNSATYEE